uniref:TAFH domain-containing protein n=1 Tax=Denticeps clupeoides TaxID=299321 RepID=A0AAY4E513_9TELE
MKTQSSAVDGRAAEETSVIQQNLVKQPEGGVAGDPGPRTWNGDESKCQTPVGAAAPPVPAFQNSAASAPATTSAAVAVARAPFQAAGCAAAPGPTTVTVSGGAAAHVQTGPRPACSSPAAAAPAAVRTMTPQVALTPRLPQPAPSQPSISNIQLPPGMVLVRSETGQLLMMPQQVLAQLQAKSQNAIAPRPANPISTATVKAPSSPIVPRQSVTPVAIAKQGAITASSMSATPTTHRPPVLQETMENVKKCKNFLSTLIKLASSGKQSSETAANVKELVKKLLEGRVEAEDFTSSLYKELNSPPQPYLVPFLKRSLPAVRQLTPDSMAFIQQSLTPAQPQKPTASVSTPRTQAQPTTLVLKTSQQGTVLKAPQVTGTTPLVTLRSQPPSRVVLGPQALAKPLMAPKPNDGEGTGGSFRDDDINDVASMAGVNLSEESARILATNSDVVGAVTRSCGDKAFLYSTALQRRILEIGRRKGITELGPDVVNFVSHAAQHRLRDILERVSTIAHHKNVAFKEDGKHEQTDDVRLQLKFFEQLDHVEKQRKEEQEREILMKAAKSRARQEDPEQLRLKQKAKEMQQQELAQMRQREANLTALAAIGPRKKRKVDSLGGGAGTEGSLSTSLSVSGAGTGPARQFTRQRITRVNLRDLLVCLENERSTCHSQLLYRALLK